MAERAALQKKTGPKDKAAGTTKPGKNFSQAPDSPVDQVLQLQRTMGNQAVQRLIKSGKIQAKLKISRPNDPYEQEADRVAEQVMRMPEPKQSLIDGHSSLLQRKSTCPGCPGKEELQTKLPAGQITPLVQRQEEDVNSSIETGINSMKGGGQPLPEAARAFFEPRFGADFSQVRVHTGTGAAQTAQSVDAKAFTTGNDIVFNRDQYSPGTPAGKHLLAHELTHVIQQGKAGSPGPSQTLQGDRCPRRETNEVANSRTPGGILAADTYITGGNTQLVIHDFGVDRVTLPINATQSEPWQRAMSYIIGDPSMRLAIEGFADCLGDTRYNLGLRRRRANAVVAAMPPEARGRILFNFSIDPGNYLDTNATAAGRARNRAVRVSFRGTAPRGRGQDPCDTITRAGNMDEYLFLVRSAEERLHLTRPADARTMLSLLRQIYFGNAAWSSSRNPIWNSVIPQRPWAPGTDPRPQLGRALFSALQNSQEVQGTDLGHLFTGLDAMLNPRNVGIPLGWVTPETNLPNEEWATWAGDVGSAAANFTLDSCFGTLRYPDTRGYFNDYANPADLYGNIDAFALRRAAIPGATPSGALMRAWRPNGRLSEILLQYYRLTGTPLGSSRSGRVRNFIEAYGGIIGSGRIANRSVLEARLLPSIQEFAGYFFLQKFLRRGNPPQGAPNPSPIMTRALMDTTRFYVDWLQSNL